MTTMTTTGFLRDELIEACGERAAGYDRDNKFFIEDWEAIKGTGFLKVNTPKELGGYGMTPLDVSQELRRLAHRAPATALAVDMHPYWHGTAAGPVRRSAATCASIGPALRPACGTTATSRWSGCCGSVSTARCTPPGTRRR